MHTTQEGERIDLLPGAFGYTLGAALNETHGCRISYYTPLDLYHRSSPIENVQGKVAAKVFAIILLIERDSPRCSYPAEHVGELPYPVAQE